MKSLQLDAPHAIVVIGIQGSGKTFFARRFADMFNAPFIDESEIGDVCGSVEVTQKIMAITLHEVVKTKATIVLEVDAAARTKRIELIRDLKKAGYETLFVWVQIDSDTAFMRSQKQRGVSADTHGRSVQRFTAPKAPEPFLVISGKHTYASQARIVLKKLSGQRPVQPVRKPPTIPPRGQIIVR